MVVLFLIPILILALVAVVPTWPYNRNWSYYPSGGVGAIIVLTIVLLFMNKL
jgi:low affinity Fe/Cu permease